MTSRAIKEEMLQSIAPDIYMPRRASKREHSTAVKQAEPALDFKPRALRKYKKAKRKAHLVPLPEEEDDDLALQFASAPRRPYQWRGRRVKRILRPGIPIIFSPGVRSRDKALKRSHDEVYGDIDMLEQQSSLQGEFAYGKRRKHNPQAEVLLSRAIPTVVLDSDKNDTYMVLDDSNPTPSLKPVTEQKIFRAAKRNSGVLEPTIQLLTPKLQKRDAIIESEPMDTAQVKVRPIKRVSNSIGVQTVDVQIPDSSVPMDIVNTLKDVATTAKEVVAASTQTMSDVGTQTQHRKPIINYSLHPTITPTPGYGGTVIVKKSVGRRPRTRPSRRRRRRRRTNRSYARRIGDSSTENMLILPSVRYHPSVNQKAREMLVIKR